MLKNGHHHLQVCNINLMQEIRLSSIKSDQNHITLETYSRSVSTETKLMLWVQVSCLKKKLASLQTPFESQTMSADHYCAPNVIIHIGGVIIAHTHSEHPPAVYTSWKFSKGSDLQWFYLWFIWFINYLASCWFDCYCYNSTTVTLVFFCVDGVETSKVTNFKLLQWPVDAKRGCFNWHSPWNTTHMGVWTECIQSKTCCWKRTVMV